MPKLFSSRQIEKALLLRGFFLISQKGSHQKFRKINGKTLTVILPAGRKEIPEGTLRSIIRQANINREDF